MYLYEKVCYVKFNVVQHSNDIMLICGYRVLLPCTLVWSTFCW